jgi:Asp-tRNA(Asn)/Glu-tRNA(Gln) amidotransferase A subunit family amidase
MRCFPLSGLALLTLFVFSGCSLLSPPHTPRNHAFTAYWPPKKSDQLKLAVKDNIDMAGVVTTAGSHYLATHAPPAKKDAACLAIARERKVQIVGKTNLSEFAVGPSGFNEYYGTPKNPIGRWWKRIPGGSSSGSGVAVAAGLADVAFGTDTAGSVRVPAACCGVVGLKTTRGLVPLKGVYPIEPVNLDTIGPMARDIATTAKGMDLLERGFAAKYAAAKNQKPLGRDIRVGRLVLKGTNSHVDAAIDLALQRAGFRVVRMNDRFREQWDQAKKDGDTIAAVGIWLNYQIYGSTLGISTRTRSGILLGWLLYGAGYREALARERLWQRTLQNAFKQVDFIALPTLQSTPPLMTINFRVGIMDSRVLGLQNTVPANLAGNPALAVPVPLRHTVYPVASLQLVGRPRREAELLNAGRLVEEALKSDHRKKSAQEIHRHSPEVTL